MVFLNTLSEIAKNNKQFKQYEQEQNDRQVQREEVAQLKKRHPELGIKAEKCF